MVVNELHFFFFISCVSVPVLVNLQYFDSRAERKDFFNDGMIIFYKIWERRWRETEEKRNEEILGMLFRAS